MAPCLWPLPRLGELGIVFSGAAFGTVPKSRSLHGQPTCRRRVFITSAYSCALNVSHALMNQLLAQGAAATPPASADPGGHAHDESETFPPSISASGRGRCCAAGSLADRLGASLSSAAGAYHRPLSCWRHGRHHSAPDRPMAVGTDGAKFPDRQPVRRRRQHRHRGGRPRAGRRLYAPSGLHRECDQCEPLSKS
jgi:hypothetical protein